MTETEKYEDGLKSLADDIEAMGADLRFNVSVQLLNTGLLLDKYIDTKARRYGQNRSRLDVMHTLIIHGGTLKPTDLSKMLFRSKQTVTGIVDGLERDGLVKRELAGKDRRTKKVTITRKGLSSIRASLPRTLEISSLAMPLLSEEEAQTLRTILRRIRKHVLGQIANSHSK
jgi:DNA-binding MarR family transcriptional regulator